MVATAEGGLNGLSRTSKKKAAAKNVSQMFWIQISIYVSESRFTESFESEKITPERAKEITVPIGIVRPQI